MRHLLRIKPNFLCPEGLSSGFNYYFQGIEDSLNLLIKKEIDDHVFESEEEFFKLLDHSLPIIEFEASKSSGIISLTCLAPATNTHGLGRFICDHSSRWLLPGKQLALVHVNSLAFSLEKAPNCQLFFHQQLIRVDQLQEMGIVLSNLEAFKKQLKMNILAVIHARNVVTQKALTFDEKKMIIQENLASLLGKSQKEIDRSAFDHTHRFIIKIISEEKVEHFKEAFHSLIDLKPQVFDRDLFNELQEQISNFSDEFIACRDIRHLTRMITYEHLFRKNLAHMMIKQPDSRHLSFKLFQTQTVNSPSNHSILAVILAVNFLKDNEVFEEKHLFKALQACYPNINKVKGSFFEHKLDKNSRALYMEIEKKDKQKFDSQELGIIKKQFSSEVKLRIESVYSPIFMPKNEEEVLKNILILSQELKYVHDIPQIHISFQKQTETQIWFNLVILRLQKPNFTPIKLLFDQDKTALKIENLESKVVGNLRKKHPKEAIICDVVLEKKQFLRKDFSLDLYNARHWIVSNLEKLMGEVRDYNGGIISKQSEALGHLRKLLKDTNINNDFLVENYFFSLSPSFMPSILPTVTLKKQLSLILKAIDKKLRKDQTFFEIQKVESHLICVMASSNRYFPNFINEQIDRRDLSSPNLTFFQMKAEELFFIGYIYKIDSDLEEKFFQNRLNCALTKWDSHLIEDVFPINPQASSWEGSLVLR